MKNLLIIVFLITSASYCQIVEPVKWSSKIKKVSDNEYDLIITADIETNYHLYSQKIPEGGPLPTVFIFEENENYELVGGMSEDKGHVVNDPTFKMNIKYFNTKATFSQRIKVKSKSHFKISGDIEFMTCNDSNCVPGYDDFEVTI